eukprot:g5494.t1
MAFARSTIPEAFTNGVAAAAATRLQPNRALHVSPATTRASYGATKINGRITSPPTVAVSAAPLLSERVGNFHPSNRTTLDKKVLPPTTNRRLPNEFYQLTNADCSVQLPSHNTVDPSALDNRELDKLVSQLGKNKTTWRRALMLHEWLVVAGHVPDDRLCTTLIRVCGQHGQTFSALSVYEWMKALPVFGGAGLCPSVYTYTAAMRAALAGNALDNALQIWTDVEASGCVPDSRLCTAYIEVCTRLGHTDKALNMYHQMRNAPTSSKMAPTVHAYTAAMRAATEGGQWECSLGIWDDMIAAGVQPSGHAFAAAISSCAAGGQWQKACDLFESMLQHGIQPDVVSCTALISALATGGQWQQSEQVVSWMLQSGVRPNVRTYTALLNSLGQAQQWQRAVTLLKKMNENQFGAVEPNAYCFSALLKALGEHGQWEVAEQVFSDLEDEALDLASSSQGTNSASNDFSPGQIAEITELIQQLGLNPDPNQTVGIQHTQNNEVLSQTVMNNALDYSGFQIPSLSTIKNDPTENIWMNSGGNTVLSNQQLNRTGNGLNQQQPMGIQQSMSNGSTETVAETSPGENQQTSIGDQSPQQNHQRKLMRARPGKINEVVCGALMTAYSKAGKWSDAVKVLGRARRLGIRPNTVMYNSAISAAGKSGQVHVCEALFNEVEEPDAVTYETVIAAYGMAGKVDCAENFFSQMLEVGLQPRDYAYCGLIAAHSMAGDWKSALSVRTRMQRACAVLTVHVYNALIAACERCGRLDHAVQLHNCMEKEGIEPNNVTISLLNSIGKQGVRAVEHQQIGASALSAALAAAGALLIQSGLVYKEKEKRREVTKREEI